MYQPGKRVCEMCQTTAIGEDGEAFPVVFYPFTAGEMDKLALEFAASVTVPENRAMLGQILPIAMPMGVQLEFCKACADGFIPMLDQLKGLAMDRIIERMRGRARHNAKTQGRSRSVFGRPDEDE